jgi:hypothetical protein
MDPYSLFNINHIIFIIVHRMGKLEFDFREGLDKDHIVYKRKGFSWKHCVYYLSYLLFTWGYAVAFFALFQFVYTNFEPVAFPIYIALWLAFVIALIIVAVINLIHSNQAKRIKVAKREAENKHAAVHPHHVDHPTGIEGRNIEMGIQRVQEGDQLVH